MYSGRGHAMGHGYYNAPDYYSKSSRIYTNRSPAPYSVPASLAGGPRTVAPASVLGAEALPYTLPAAAATAAVAGMERGGYTKQHF